MDNIHIKTLKRRITAAEGRYKAAEARGETESYLSLCRFKIDELKAALEREEKRAAA